jgi:SAM-dependent methyltransferase
MSNRYTSGLLSFLNRYAFKQYYVIQYGLQKNPAASRPVRFWGVLQSLFKYPLPRNQVLHYCPVLTHPQPLKTWAQVEASYQNALASGLIPHKAREKNWDFLNAFGLIMARQRRDDVIVDMGTGSGSSVILRWLALYGYRNLHGCDLYVTPHTEGHIRYTVQNIEHTEYPEDFADVITCLSVIEHGVHLEPFLAECRRILKPGGLLILSTDYWCEPLNVEGVRDELGPVYIYAPDTIRSVVEIAGRCGLRVIGEADFTCGDPVVRRPSVPEIHQKYTFYCLHFERPA